MKKILTLAVLAVASLAATAQTYIGGSVGLGYDIDSEKVNFTLAPEVGYNLNSKLAIGTTLAYSYNGELKVNDKAQTVQNIFNFDPYVRYTFARVAENKLSFFCDGTVGVGVVKNEGADAGATWKVGFKPGMSYALSSKCSLVAHFGFLGYEGADDNAKVLGQKNKVGFDFGSLNLSFGAYFTF